jgi:group I intron endonuclease
VYKNTGIYEIRNTLNGKRYVGSAVSFEARWKLHRFHLGKGKHHSRHLQASWDKHGSAAFEFRTLLICSRHNLLMYEQAAIDALNPEFNTARTAGSWLGLKHSEETKRKLSILKMGNQATLGYKHRPESLERLRLKQMGVSSPTKGTKRNADAVAATASAHRGMKRSAETRRRISEAMTGKKRPPRGAEYRANLSRALRASWESRKSSAP